MEGGVQRGRWNMKAPIGTILLLMCMFIPTLTLLQTSEGEQKCQLGDYLTENGICCNKCPAGLKLVEICTAVGQRSNCTLCPIGQYMDQMNYSPNCRRCKRCKTSKHEKQVSPCERRTNTICRCEEGYYKFHIDSETYECRSCTQCGPDEKEKQTCTPEANTVCECKENYYRVNSKCEPCKTCTAECKHHCSPNTLNTRAPDTGKQYLITIIGGVSAVALVLLLVVVVGVSYVAPKLTTKFLKPSLQPTDVSSDSCNQVMLQEEPLHVIVKAAPQSLLSEQEVSILPDCVPLEIKISDLIYTVLDLVPVLQVKQLVRSLGVKDTEIEQAELDHRSCREAHYQMLRVWAEMGSRTGGGGRDRMLHWPLLQELLDELRNMHLGRAVEELQTKYGIQ